MIKRNDGLCGKTEYLPGFRFQITASWGEESPKKNLSPAPAWQALIRHQVQRRAAKSLTSVNGTDKSDYNLVNAGRAPCL